MADLIAQALAETEGGVLAFLPGEGEIRRVEALLRGRLPGGLCAAARCSARWSFAAQRAAMAPSAAGRKVVLATSIAETSLTIDGHPRRGRCRPRAARPVRSAIRACRGW